MGSVFKDLLVRLSDPTSAQSSSIHSSSQRLKPPRSKPTAHGQCAEMSSSTHQRTGSNNHKALKNMMDNVGAIQKFQSILIKFSVSLSFCLPVILSFCLFHSGDFIFKAICKIFFSSFRASAWECFSQIRI